jgi:hypothetical protein
MQNAGLDRQRNESGAEEFHTGAAGHLALIVFSRFTWPSTGPLLQRSVTAASTAKMSRCNRDSKCWINAMPLDRARSIHRCNAVTVRTGGRGVAGGDCLSTARKPIISERITA